MGDYVNSTAAKFDKSFVSCGVMEVHHLPKNNAAQTLFAIANALYHKANPRPAAFVLFSDVIPEENIVSRGMALATEIKKTPVAGILTETDKAVNPKSGNTIKVYLLTINHDSFRKWYQEELANRITD